MTALLELTGIDVRFGGLRAVAGLNLAVHEGTIHALIGPNGAGKSTVFNCISRFYQPTAGDIRFAGRSLLRDPPHAIARYGIGRTFQNLELCGRMTALESVLVGMSSVIPRGGDRAARQTALALLDRLGLAAQADMPAEQLAFGQQKLLDLARALACRPRLLLLDEPAAGLRTREVRALDALLVDIARREGVTILLVEHVMSLVMGIADRVTVLNFGEKIAEGAPADIRCDPLVIEAYLGRAADAAH